jgi:hypothetical protein
MAVIVVEGGVTDALQRVLIGQLALLLFSSLLGSIPRSASALSIAAGCEPPGTASGGKILVGDQIARRDRTDRDEAVPVSVVAH